MRPQLLLGPVAGGDGQEAFGPEDGGRGVDVGRPLVGRARGVEADGVVGALVNEDVVQAGGEERGGAGAVEDVGSLKRDCSDSKENILWKSH